MPFRGPERPSHQLAVGRAHLGYARHMQQLPAARGFEFAPQRIGPVQQWNIGGILEITEADDAGETVRGSPVMAGLEALEAQHPQTSARKMIERSAAHHAGANDDDIMLCHGRSPARKSHKRGLLHPETEAALSFLILSHFRTENRKRGKR